MKILSEGPYLKSFISRVRPKYRERFCSFSVSVICLPVATYFFSSRLCDDGTKAVKQVRIQHAIDHLSLSPYHRQSYYRNTLVCMSPFHISKSVGLSLLVIPYHGCCFCHHGEIVNASKQRVYIKNNNITVVTFKIS